MLPRGSRMTSQLLNLAVKGFWRQARIYPSDLSSRCPFHGVPVQLALPWPPAGLCALNIRLGKDRVLI